MTLQNQQYHENIRGWQGEGGCKEANGESKPFLKSGTKKTPPKTLEIPESNTTTLHHHTSPPKAGLQTYHVSLPSSLP